MSIKSKNNEWEPLNPGFIERWGLKIIEFNIKKIATQSHRNIELKEFYSNANIIIRNSTLHSFLIGLIVTVFYVIAYLAVVEYYPSELIDFQDLNFYYKWFWILLVLGIFTYIELYLVYRVGLKAVCKMAYYVGFDLSDDPILITKNKNILSRIALEIPDHRLIVLGINPEKLLNKKSLFIKTIIYKAKIVASNFIAKLIVRRILARSALRAYSDFIIAPITGFWDGLVTYITLIEMRKRLFTRILAEDLLSNLINKCNIHGIIFQELCMRAIASAVILNFKFHPNLEFLLLKLYENFGLPNDLSHPLDDIEFFLNKLDTLDKEKYRGDLLALVYFCFAVDGKFTNFEKKIAKSCKTLSSIESQNIITKLSKAINKCDIEIVNLFLYRK
ncbi:MAG: hypothetical protein JJT78_16965 [Leptospira sp.]|nr:hypothetical protein [Leptospira sp.]